MTDNHNLIDAAARFIRERDPSAEMIAHREVVKRAREAVMPKKGTNDNQSGAI